MNNIAIAGLIGGGIGAVKGIVDEKRNDPRPTAGSYIGNAVSNGIGFAAIAAGGAGVISYIKDPKSVAKAISGSKIAETNLYKTLVPEKEKLTKDIISRMPENFVNVDEARKEIIGSINDNKAIFKEVLSDDAIKAMKEFKNSDLSSDSLDKLNKKLNESIDNKDISDSIVEDFKTIINNKTYNKKPTEEDIKTLPWYTKAKEYSQSYYFSQNKKDNYIRVGATAGAISAVGVGTRYLSGGTLTRDQYGQKDIAGIPFI